MIGVKRVHDLDISGRWLQAILDGDKTHEVRKDNRDFQKGDFVNLSAIDPENLRNAPQGASLYCEVTHVQRGGQFGIEPGWVVLSLYVGAKEWGQR